MLNDQPDPSWRNAAMEGPPSVETEVTLSSSRDEEIIVEPAFESQGVHDSIRDQQDVEERSGLRDNGPQIGATRPTASSHYREKAAKLRQSHQRQRPSSLSAYRQQGWQPTLAEQAVATAGASAQTGRRRLGDWKAKPGGLNRKLQLRDTNSPTAGSGARGNPRRMGDRKAKPSGGRPAVSCATIHEGSSEAMPRINQTRYQMKAAKLPRPSATDEPAHRQTRFEMKAAKLPRPLATGTQPHRPTRFEMKAAKLPRPHASFWNRERDHHRGVPRVNSGVSSIAVMDLVQPIGEVDGYQESSVVDLVQPFREGDGYQESPDNVDNSGDSSDSIEQPSSAEPETDDLNLVVATPVAESSPHLLPQAEEVPNPQRGSANETKLRICKTMGILILLVAPLVGGTMLAIFFSSNNQETETSLNVVTDASSDSALDMGMENGIELDPVPGSGEQNGKISDEVPFSNHVLSLLPPDTVNNINRASTPQNKSYQWLLEDPFSGNYSDARIVQRFALATFFYSTNGDEWRNRTNWLSHIEHECDWFFGGIQHNDADDEWQPLINAVGIAIGAHKPCKDLDGVELDGYRHIGLLRNQLRGTIPQEVLLLTGLQTLNLYDNALTGTVPENIADLGNLTFFVLGFNDITGTIPAGFGSIEALRMILLSGCSMEGSIPTELSALHELEHLWLDDNFFDGPILSELGRLQNLQTLQLWANNFSGLIPSEMGLLTSLWLSWMDWNKLSGRIPSELGQLKAFQDLQPSIELLEELFPPFFLKQMKKKLMGQLDLDQNLLSGPVPSELGLLSSLQKLRLDHNHLTHQIPSDLGRLAKMTQLQMNDNFFSGPIPSEIGSLTSLIGLILSSNQLSNSVPSGILLLSKLEFLYLADNQLSGIIPDQLELMPRLTGLYLHTNQFSGQIPTELGLLSQLERLYLLGNRLSGRIPSELGLLASVTELRLDQNDLTGHLPNELGMIVNQSEVFELLNVSGNDLTGTISSSLCGLDDSESRDEVNGGLFSGWDCTLSPTSYLCGLYGLESQDVGLFFDCSDKLCGCSCSCSNLGSNSRH